MSNAYSRKLKNSKLWSNKMLNITSNLIKNNGNTMIVLKRIVKKNRNIFFPQKNKMKCMINKPIYYKYK